LFGSIAASVGQQLSDAETASTSDQATFTSAQTNRQQQIGVSLNQEAANITTYQRDYGANAQVVSISEPTYR
jgi:flagellar hook-associated protein 1 FlgK